jgi:hypothetical protein
VGIFLVGTKNPDCNMEKVKKNHSMNITSGCVGAMVEKSEVSFTIAFVPTRVVCLQRSLSPDTPTFFSVPR